MATKASRTIRVVLKLPEKVADFIVRAQTIHDTMAANSGSLPKPTPALSVLASHIADLMTKEAGVKVRTLGAAADRDAAKKAVSDDLSGERAYVEQLVNADPANAAIIAQDAAMTLRTQAPRSKPLLAIKRRVVSGTVQAVAKAAKGAKANHWEYSTDGGKTWIELEPTTGARTTVQNLTPGSTVSFRHCVLTKAGLSDWGDPVSTLVI
jgi:hypothetical protein